MSNQQHLIAEYKFSHKNWVSLKLNLFTAWNHKRVALQGFGHSIYLAAQGQSLTTLKNDWELGRYDILREHHLDPHGLGGITFDQLSLLVSKQALSTGNVVKPKAYNIEILLPRAEKKTKSISFDWSLNYQLNFNDQQRVLTIEVPKGKNQVYKFKEASDKFRDMITAVLREIEWEPGTGGFAQCTGLDLDNDGVSKTCFHYGPLGEAHKNPRLAP